MAIQILIFSFAVQDVVSSTAHLRGNVFDIVRIEHYRNELSVATLRIVELLRNNRTLPLRTCSGSARFRSFKAPFISLSADDKHEISLLDLIATPPGPTFTW